MIRKIFSIIIGGCLSLAVLSAATTVMAQPFDPLNDVCTGSGSASTVCQDAQSTESTSQSESSNKIYGPNGVLTKIANMVSIVVGIAAVIMLLIGSFKYINSAGDSAQAVNARKTITFAIVGILATLFAQATIYFVLDKL